MIDAARPHDDASQQGGGPVAPVLVLGLGNLLLRDDGVGLALLEALRERVGDDPRVEMVDGGTQGIALVGLLAGRRAALLLDAVARGEAPGTVHVVDDVEESMPPRASTAHEGNAGDLLRVADLIGDRPGTVAVVGIEPAVVRTGTGLSRAVREALPAAVDAALAALEGTLRPVPQPRSGDDAGFPLV